MLPPDRQLHHLLQRLHPVPSPEEKTGQTLGVDEVKKLSRISSTWTLSFKY